jgi:hypothetical protein
MQSSLRIIALVMVVTLMPSVAVAKERLGDSLMGAAAGAVVGGPVGAVAGGIVGYTAGPDIARGLGIKGRHHHSHRPKYDRGHVTD